MLGPDRAHRTVTRSLRQRSCVPELCIYRFSRFPVAWGTSASAEPARHTHSRRPRDLSRFARRFDRRRRAARRSRLHRGVRAEHGPLGQLRPRLHLPLAARRRVLAVRLSLTVGGPPSIWWIVIVGAGQLLVSLVFGEVVSQYPIHGGIYPWTRRLWGRRVRLDGRLGLHLGDDRHRSPPWPSTARGFVAACSASTRHRRHDASWLAARPAADRPRASTTAAPEVARPRIARIGLAAELIGVIALGLYLLIFQREQDVRRSSSTPWASGATAATWARSSPRRWPGCSCSTASRRAVTSPRRSQTRPGASRKAMILTILVGGVSGALLVRRLRARRTRPAGDRGRRGRRPDPGDPRVALGTVGAKVFLVIAITAFLSCVLSLQAAASRLLYSFARDGCCPAAAGCRKVSATASVPTNALIVVCIVPALIACSCDFERRPALPGDGVRRARHLRRLPDGRARGAAAAAQGLEARPGCGTWGRPASSSTSRRSPTASSR